LARFLEMEASVASERSVRVLFRIFSSAGPLLGFPGEVAEDGVPPSDAVSCLILFAEQCTQAC